MASNLGLAKKPAIAKHPSVFSYLFSLFGVDIASSLINFGAKVSTLLRRAISKTHLSWDDDVARSFARIFLTHAPVSAAREFFTARGIDDVLSSPRFKGEKDDVLVTVQEPNPPGYWIRGKPSNDDEFIVLWIHGGGYVCGHPLEYFVPMLRATEIAAKSGVKIKVFAMKYSLAPEAEFPRQQEEAVAAYRYLIETENVDARKIIISGESAGSHLALSCLVGMDLPRPAGAFLVCPWTNLRSSGATFKSNGYNDILEKYSLEWWGDLALGHDGHQKHSDLVNFSAPLESGRSWADVLPPYTIVNVGGDEILFDETNLFVKTAQDQGAKVELEVTPGMCHSWQVIVDEEMQEPYYSTPKGEEFDGKMLGSENIASAFLKIVDSVGYVNV